MKNLSTEILFIIFKYLHFKQRVQCAQTCRKWAAILQSGLHLETTVVVNPNSNSTYNAFMNKMESSSDLYRQQCRRLVMQCLFNQPCDYSKILKYFPNLTYLYLEGDDVSQADLELNHIFNLQVWRNKLSTIKIKGYGETFLQMLDSGTFNALTTLDVSSNVPSNYRRIHLISALQNTPNLIHLSLSYLRIDIDELEMLHINLPSLNSLILKAKGIKTDMEISDKIQPVSNLKSLKIIQHYTGSIMTAKFKQYLEAKYRHLEALSIIQPDLVLNDIAKRNANMTISLFASIGKNVSKLEFDLPSIPTDDQDFLTSMPLTHFSASLLLSEQLVSSWIVPSKLRGIQSLKLKDIPRLDFSIFRQFTELKVLELNFEEKPGGKYNVELCQVLKHDLPEKLESLGLGYTKVHIIDATRAVGASNIKELKFKRSELSSYLDGYIASHMKSLDTLFLHSCKIGFVTKKKDRFGIPRIIKDHGECRFELPSHRLKMASIEISNKHFRSGRKNDAYYELYSIPTHLKLTLGENTECYSSPRGGLDYERCGELYGTPNGRTRIGLEPFEIYSGEKGETIHDHAIQRVHDPIPSSENTRYFEFKCADVQTIYFNGCLLL